jgi:hypothetical protein
MSYISFCVQDSNDIPTATPTFLGSSSMMRLIWILSDIGVTGISEMAAINRKYICKILYLSMYMRQQRDSNGYHIYRVRLYGGTSAECSNIQVYWEFKMAANYRKSLENST